MRRDDHDRSIVARATSRERTSSGCWALRRDGTNHQDRNRGVLSYSPRSVHLGVSKVAVQMVLEYLGDAVGVGEPYNDIVTPGITLAILVLFFMAIVSKRRIIQ